MLAVNIDMHVGDVRITPMVAHARALVEVGTDVIELEVDVEKCRRNGQDISKLIGDMIRLGVPVKAGVGRPEDGVVAVQAGVTFVSSSTSGYTPEVEKMKLPDIRLMAALIRSVTGRSHCRARVFDPNGRACGIGCAALAVVGGRQS